MADHGTPEKLYDAIEQVLRDHRVSSRIGDDGALPLVDCLCNSDAEDISQGQHEIRLICDAIYNEVLVPAFATHPSAPVAWVHPGEIERLRRGQDVQCARLWAKPHPVDTPLYTHPPAVQPVAPTGAQIRAALAHPGCDRLREWAAIGPAQRAAVELFADLLAATPSAPVAPAGMPDRLLQAGAALANCAFNLAQRGPGEFTARDIKALDQCRRAWDAARAATPSAEAQPTSKEPTP
jgi:hypothetical protein